MLRPDSQNAQPTFHDRKSPATVTPSGSAFKVLFLCTGNSCRSQMAEGWARHLLGDQLCAFSAGLESHGLNPDAVRVMAEVGVDISQHRSKRLADLGKLDFDWIITVCDAANEACPVVPGAIRTLHHGFDDPPRLAAGAINDSERLAPYRRVRDEIKAFVESLPARLREL